MTSWQRNRPVRSSTPGNAHGSPAPESIRFFAERDNKIEATLTEFFTTGDERDHLIAQLTIVENTIGQSVQRLFDLGETTARFADLLALEPKEVERLRSLAA
ncbi:hypothetical protein RCH23_002272 [Cryobacterium sp. CAN_C3]|uniref:hypothetical protein n=1 Tax=unclassified Cryobacterium TaxID=2649013 RepID=UPI0018C8FEEA|nr:hypothetical protein [Cryobacterium sp. CAN_C3]MEC5154884.1 hypothetical protein [Cryobacterium sp. CAN_C3]